VSETELREEEYRLYAHGQGSNMLVWAGFSVTEFALIATIFTAFKIQTNILAQALMLITLIDGCVLTASSVLFMAAASPVHRLRNLKDKEGNSAANPRQLLVERAEVFMTMGMVLQTLVALVFIAFMGLYWLLPIGVVVYVLLYIYTIPLSYPEEYLREKEPKKSSEVQRDKDS